LSHATIIVLRFAMERQPDGTGDVQADLVAAAGIIALRANLALTPVQRIAELVAMNRFHAEIQARTVPSWLRAALDAREIEEARQRLREADE
jgi:hypothetical protein